MKRTGHFRTITLLAAMVVASLLGSVLLAGFAGDASAQTACVAPSSGMVGWWPWDGNGTDIKGGNNATLSSSATFPTGEVNQALHFNGTDTNGQVPASSSLNVGSGNGLSIEGWIKPGTLNASPLVEWNNGGSQSFGTHLWSSFPSSGILFANLVDTSQSTVTYHEIQTDSAVLTANQWQHVALTYDKSSGTARLFRNGTVVKELNLGSNFTPQTTYNLYFGYRPGTGLHYFGDMDDVAIYGRALSQSEVQAIYNAGSAGKCQDITPPTTTASATTSDGSSYASGDQTRKDVTVSLSATDNTGGSGVKQITYSATGAQSIASTTVPGSSAQVPTITTDGTTTISYFATDNDGNAETPQTFTVKLDKTAPTVSSVFPVNAATQVPRDTKPTATFSEEMQAGTLSTSDVKMTNQSTKKRVPVAVSCDNPCKTLTIDPYPSDPSKLLASRTKYKVVILGGSSGPEDLSGLPMDKSEVWTFTTGSN